MNFLRTLFFATVMLFASRAANAEVELRFDLTAAEAVMALFEHEEPTRADVEALLELPGVKATISQTSRFDSDATEEAYIESLLAILSGETPENDPFRFAGVRDRLDAIRVGLADLKANQGDFAADISQMMGSYTSAATNVETMLYAVLGGTSDAWAPGNGNFYMALQYFRDDAIGLAAMTAHEVYHVVQKSFFHVFKDERPTIPARMLAENLFLEGTATLVGDPMNFEGDGSYLEFLQDKHTRNLRRINENFALFEALYFRAANDPEVPFGPIYNLGFSGGWDSPLYFVGFHITQGLEKHLGRERLVEILGTMTGPEILAEYIRVYRETGDMEMVTFSPTIEALIQAQIAP